MFNSFDGGNLLENGGFDGNLDEWTGTGTINRADGYPRLGCVALAAGQSIAQTESVNEDQLYTLHYFYRLAEGATLTAGYGSIAQTHTGAPLNTWQEGVLVFALDAGASEAVQFSAAGGAVSVDSVTLLGQGIPITRQGILSTVAARIEDLASDAGLSSTGVGDQPEGDYSHAIDEALRQVGAVNRWGDPDVTRLETGKVNDLVEAATTAMLQRLRARYALETDVSLGPRRENRSQIAGSIDQMLAGGAADRRVKVGNMRRAGGWER